jgi:thiamine pyrophosphate-dependent acetolactate synthase large subunit-like protein
LTAEAAAMASSTLTRRAAVAAVLGELAGSELVVAANGHISRDAQSCRRSAQDFYMLGSMGLAAAIGLGLALAEPDARIVVLDGDGNLLMGLGVLPMIGAWQPRRFLHLVLDNATYASTGGQATVSPAADLAAAALACGYRQAADVASEADLRAAARAFLDAEGPALLRVRVTGEEPPAQPRVDLEPPKLARRFAAAVGERRR